MKIKEKHAIFTTRELFLHYKTLLSSNFKYKDVGLQVATATL